MYVLNDEKSKQILLLRGEDKVIVGVILPVENKIMPIVHLKLKLTKTHPLFYTFCPKHSGCVFAGGKNVSTPLVYRLTNH